MSDVVQSAAPAAAPAANAQESANLSAEESQVEGQLDASSEESEEENAKPTEKSSKKDAAKAKEVEKRLKKLKLKVDNKEIEEEIDLDDDEALIRHLQLGKMGQKRAQEKAELEKKVQKLIMELDSDPFEVMRQFGKNPDDIIEAYINKQMEQAKKSPEQIEKERLEAELKAMRDEREKEKETFKQKEIERLQQQAFQQYDVQMEQALSKSSLPKTAYTVKKMADYMLVALEAGYDVTPEDVIPVVQEELNSDLKEMFASLPEDQIEALLGEQVLNKMRKRRVAKAQEAQKLVGKPNVADTGSNSKEEKVREKQSFKNFFGI